jgi:hypothetical protein
MKLENLSLYDIRNDGSIYSYASSKEMKKSVSSGYEVISLYNDSGVRKTYKVHRLIAEAFLGIPLPKMEVNHKDGNKLNNNAFNLEWVTRSENQQHARRLGLNKSRPSRKATIKGLSKAVSIRAKQCSIPVVIEKEGLQFEFDSGSAAALHIGAHRSSISHAIKKNHKINGWKIQYL